MAQHPAPRQRRQPYAVSVRISCSVPLTHADGSALQCCCTLAGHAPAAASSGGRTPPSASTSGDARSSPAADAAGLRGPASSSKPGDNNGHEYSGAAIAGTVLIVALLFSAPWLWCAACGPQNGRERKNKNNETQLQTHIIHSSKRVWGCKTPGIAVGQVNKR